VQKTSSCLSSFSVIAHLHSFSFLVIMVCDMNVSKVLIVGRRNRRSITCLRRISSNEE